MSASDAFVLTNGASSGLGGEAGGRGGGRRLLSLAETSRAGQAGPEGIGSHTFRTLDFCENSLEAGGTWPCKESGGAGDGDSGVLRKEMTGGGSGLPGVRARAWAGLRV